ncbi:zinc ribbon domain-containing protein [Streptococcus parauberis]|uniref:zinc ribbon domain-containing protein n=1 Tax=Streptococcus TaxID=1301 RepID=UPI00044C67DF|nr:hypothetical protein [Streptococcus parauberis]KYP18114.1 hypothetical protein AKL14_01570 [Streptococcus parauberis]KYP19013.1 hypothetical protein TN39_01213 [Streptococcus parauberis]KYP19771.1 hypothetical protein AKL13_01484 [Streptococcus parauberis]KYP23257.1 hypothetical protein ADO04_01678 [Streptococcus parauberis]KYP26728.1 hypothetical protein TP84_01149 [Streptococcus parauberis]
MSNMFKKKWVKVTSAILVTLMLVLVAVGAYFTSKSAVIHNYVSARSNKQGAAFENIKEYLVWADTNKKVTNDQAQYANFEKFDRNELKSQENKLKNATAEDDYYVKSVGRKFLIFPDYRIAIRPIQLEIKTNVPSVDIMLNKKLVTTSNSENFSAKLERIPVSNYVASLDGQYKNRLIKVSKTYDGSSKLIDLTVVFKNFSVTSNSKEGELFVNESPIGMLKDGSYDVKDYPMTEIADVYLKKSFADGDVTSKKVKLSDIKENDKVALDFENQLDQAKAGQYLISVFDQLMIYNSNRQDPANLETIFEGGANNDFYKGLKESIKSKMETDKRLASSFAIPNIVLNGLAQVGKESFLVDFAATYDYTYNKETDKEKGSSGHILQELTGELVLKKSGNGYVVSQKGAKNISVTSEKNQIKEPALLPDGVVGTWKGEKDDITYTLTIAQDGTVTRKVDFKDPKKPDENKVAKITNSEDKSNGNYHLTFATPTDGGIMVIGGGIGGAGIQYTYGFNLSGDSLTPVVWQTAMNSEFDFSKPLPGLTLKKQ